MDTFQAISDANRRLLLDLLRERDHSVQQLVPHLGITIGGVSQHLKVLLDCDLVERRREGRFCFYSARPMPLREVHDWTERYRRFWTGRLERLGEYLEESE